MAQAALARFALGGMLPILTFYALFRLAGPTAGIVGGMAVSLCALAIQARRLGRIDPIVVVPLVVIAVQGSSAVLLQSVELYLAAPAVENFLWGVALTVSVVLRRPLVRVIARELRLIPAEYTDSPAVGGALRVVTLAWALAGFVKGGVRLWLLSVLPLEMFLVAVTVFNMALNGATLVFSFWWPLRAVKQQASATSTSPPGAETAAPRP